VFQLSRRIPPTTVDSRYSDGQNPTLKHRYNEIIALSNVPRILTNLFKPTDLVLTVSKMRSLQFVDLAQSFLMFESPSYEYSADFPYTQEIFVMSVMFNRK
jgi:hypothetical protein